MILLVPAEVMKAVQAAGAKSKALQGHPWEREVDTVNLVPSDVQRLRTACADPGLSKELSVRRVVRRLDALAALQEAGVGAAVKRLEVLVDAFHRYLRAAHCPWLFVAQRHESYGPWVPWYVDGVEFCPSRRSGHDYYPAYVEVSLKAMRRGKRVSNAFRYHATELPSTVADLLSARDSVAATADLASEYAIERALYQATCEDVGSQWLAEGTGIRVHEEDDRGRIGRGSELSFGGGNGPPKVVVDDHAGRGTERTVVPDYWAPTKKVGKDPEGDEEDAAVQGVELPVQPIVRAFCLRTHAHVDVHVANLRPYEFDPALGKKLVLPPAQRDLVDALTQRDGGGTDVVAGKAAGTILLCSGPPGVGKTLTAEVYSEVARRPLYVVQCSQLGTDEEELEHHLATVLERATRWKAILLIDEADVYVQARGRSIDQNAIVGVFLRLLEYYSGILFLTTNRATAIDDAIINRLTAHVRYRIPSGSARNRLWSILLVQAGVDVADAWIEEAVLQFPEVSGRTIRQLVRLGVVLAAHKGQSFGIPHLVAASKFQGGA